MDPDLILIFSFVIIVTAIIGMSVNGIVQKVLDYKRSQAGIAQTGEPTPATRDIADRTDLIEDRLRVLERIATDRGSLLSDEIEALRHNRSAKEADKEPS